MYHPLLRIYSNPFKNWAVLYWVLCSGSSPLSGKWFVSIFSQNAFSLSYIFIWTCIFLYLIGFHWFLHLVKKIATPQMMFFDAFKSFVVSAFTFRSMIHLEFLCLVRGRGKFFKNDYLIVSERFVKKYFHIKSRFGASAKNNLVMWCMCICFWLCCTHLFALMLISHGF